MSELLVWFGVAALVTCLLVALLRQLSLHLDLLDHPNHRSLHQVPTPRVGGVGIALVVLGGLVLLALRAPLPASAAALVTLSGLGLALAAISIYDDVRSVQPHYRLLAHVAIAGLVVALVGRIDVIEGGVLGRLELTSPWAEVLTVMWVVSLINAVNFIDGIDGMAGAQAGLAGVSWILFATAASAELGVAGALVAGAAVGFLIHNWSPARIFMGDGGSALFGFLLATVPWILGGSTLWLASAFVIWPALLDTAYTLLKRLLKGEPVWESHRLHIYQQLVAAGQAPSRVTLAYALASSAGLVVALLTVRNHPAALLVGSVSLVAFVAWSVSARRSGLAPEVGTTREG